MVMKRCNPQNNLGWREPLRGLGDGETVGSWIGGASFGSVTWTLRLRIFLVIGVAICAAGCGGASSAPDENSPSPTVPATATTNGVAAADDLPTTTEASVTSLSAVTTTTLVLNTSPETTLGTVDETTPSNNSTTTTVLIETLTPDAETFEPEAPQAGFVTHEPNA